MPESHTINEYTDPQTHSNHLTQRTAEIRCISRLCLQIPHRGISSLNRTAFSATLHCLTGCAIGEVLGIVIGTVLGWSTVATIALAIVLAFFFGYGLTMLPLLRSG